MKILVIVGFCLVLTQALPRKELRSQWEIYKKSHGKVYEGEEDAKRFSIFEKNLKKIAEHNEKYRNGEVSYRLGINQFTDREADVKTLVNDVKGFLRSSQSYDFGHYEVPASIDWRKKGIVTPVKDQGELGSCSVFSAIGSLEGQQALKSGKLVALSEQNIADCDPSNNLPDQVFAYIKANGGIDTEKSYPTTGKVEPCHFSKKDVGAVVTGYVDLPQGDENALQNAVANIGPISVIIDASNMSFQMYSGGVYNEPNCSADQLDHAVLIVGYGTENGKDYWLVKNSWGAQWGEQGYIKMTRNGNNQCGIATQASYPTV